MPKSVHHFNWDFIIWMRLWEFQVSILGVITNVLGYSFLSGAPLKMELLHNFLWSKQAEREVTAALEDAPQWTLYFHAHPLQVIIWLEYFLESDQKLNISYSLILSLWVSSLRLECSDHNLNISYSLIIPWIYPSVKIWLDFPRVWSILRKENGKQFVLVTSSTTYCSLATTYSRITWSTTSSTTLMASQKL